MENEKNINPVSTKQLSRKWMSVILTALIFIIASTVFLRFAGSSETAAPDGARPASHSGSISKDKKAELNKLATLGYLGGYRAPEKDVEETEMRINQMAPGLTLYTSGESPSAYLVNSSGKVVHQWSASFDSVFPDMSKQLSKSAKLYTTYWRHATLLPDGELLVIFEGLGLAKLDRNSKVIWAKENKAHHDLELLPDGGFLIIRRATETYEGKSVFADYLSFCDKDGNEQRSISLLEAALQSDFKEQILGGGDLRGDIFHTNSVQTLTAEDAAPLPGVSAGDILVSIRNRSILVIINPDTKKVVWTFRGQFKRQHYARLYDHGALILFDNRGLGKRSQVLIYNWPHMDLNKAITKLPSGRTFFSNVMGLTTILPNGNYLLVDSLSGKIYELTDGGDLAWSFSNPHRAGQKNRLVATIPHAIRIPPEGVKGWVASN